MPYKDKTKNNAYNNLYIANHYDRINLTVPAGHKARIKAAADLDGQSVNAWLLELINAGLEEAETRGQPKPQPTQPEALTQDTPKTARRMLPYTGLPEPKTPPTAEQQADFEAKRQAAIELLSRG